MTISVIIATRDRRSDLVRTSRRLASIRPAPDEVLICADGCSDGTADLVRAEFSEFIVLENDPPLGSVGSRDRLLRIATGDIVVSLDDDSYPLSDEFFARLPDLFLAHPEAAVIAFPELRDDKGYADTSKTDKSPGHYVSAYANCAAAMRRETYLRQPGFPLFFTHAYEEPDYALQCYAAGLAVWFEPSLVIRHHRSLANRIPILQHHQNSRNELWSVWIRCPWPWLPAVSLFRLWRQFQYSWTRGLSWAIKEPVWWCQALAGARECVRARRPITWPRYYAWMRLARRPVLAPGNRVSSDPQSL